MTHRIKTRLFAPLLASILVPTLAATSVLAAPSVARAAVSKANCQMHAVLLSKDGDGTIPKELAFLRSTFETDEFAAYKGFFLLERKTAKLALDTKAETSFKSGHRLGLTLRGGTEQRLKLHADLSSRDGSKALLSTGYEIDDAGVLMISAGSYSDEKRSGKAFFAISCSAAK
jgi:hypothetical protein